MYPGSHYVREGRVIMLLAAEGKASYAEGLELASRHVEAYALHDPRAIRSAASSLEARATTTLELGFACGLRLIASDLEDVAGDIADLEARQMEFLGERLAVAR